MNVITEMARKIEFALKGITPIKKIAVYKGEI